jgi:hypothetical protein
MGRSPGRLEIDRRHGEGGSAGKNGAEAAKGIGRKTADHTLKQKTVHPMTQNKQVIHHSSVLQIKRVSIKTDVF